MQKSLSQFEKGEKIKIIGINCGRQFSRRLCDLGVFEGTEVAIVKNDKFGPIIVKILNSKIALGQGEVSKIYGESI